MLRVIIKSYNGNDYNGFVKALAGSTNHEDLRVAWELAWRLKQFKTPIALPCFSVDDAEEWQTRLRAAGAVCHAVRS